MILHESKNAKVEWIESDRIILKAFKSFIQGDELKSAFNAGYEKLKNEKGTKWLSDNRGIPVYKAEDVKWINEDWFPRILKAGWKYWALVEPETAVGAMVMKQFTFYIEKGITLQVFHSIEKAQAWLKSCK